MQCVYVDERREGACSDYTCKNLGVNDLKSGQTGGLSRCT